MWRRPVSLASLSLLLHSLSCLLHHAAAQTGFQSSVVCGAQQYQKSALPVLLQESGVRKTRPAEQFLTGSPCGPPGAPAPQLHTPLPLTEVVLAAVCPACPNCTIQLPDDIMKNKVNVVLFATKSHTGDVPVNIHFFEVESFPPTLTCSFESDSTDALRSFSKTSVLFVSISFIILMVISLAWLVFYYVQRFRYAHAKDRLQRRLFNAAKKALARIPARSVRTGDPELEADCPVCIDPYASGDVVRTLPCRHVFHKTCIDPWLLEHRTCPMCKADILKAFGYQVSVNGGDASRSDAVVERDAESPEPASTGSESAVYPFHHAATDLHDPFNCTPSSSPQLVMNSASAKTFSIIPLTVHKPDDPPPRAESVGGDQAGPSSSAPGRLAPLRGHSQGQLVNLVEVRQKPVSLARAATFRTSRPSTSEPTPIEATSTESI